MISIQNIKRSFLLRCITLVAFSLINIGVSSAEDKVDLTLKVGEIENIFVGSVVRVAVGRDDLIRVNALDNGKIVLIPLKDGNTDFIVWREGNRVTKYTVKILPSGLEDRKDNLSSLLRDYPNVSSRVSGDRVVLEGTADPEDISLIIQATENMPGVISMVKPMFSTRDMVNIQFTVLEVEKRYRREIGIRWSDSTSGPTVAVLKNFTTNRLFNDAGQAGGNNLGSALNRLPVENDGFFPFSGIASTLASTIQLIEENGGGRILAQPTLSARSGGEAKFLAGGEVPFIVVGALGQPGLEFFNYGVSIEIKPYSDGNGNIMSELKVEVSTLDQGVAVNGVPGKLTRETETVINVLDGQTIAISGLVSATDNKNRDQVPLLGNLPILGALFRSRDFQEQRTELVILATPRVVNSDDKANYNEQLKSNKEELEQIMGGSSSLQDALAQ